MLDLMCIDSLSTIYTSRYQDPEVVEFLLCTCALDPRFKSLPHIDEEDRINIWAKVNEECLAVHEVLKAI